MLDVHDLRVVFETRRRRQKEAVTAVGGVSFSIAPGETLGLVGESGSGKSTIGNAILGLVRPTDGQITFKGKDITHATTDERRRLSRHIQAIFQDPFGSLNPSLTVGQTLREPLRATGRQDRETAKQKVLEILAQVGMPADTMERYPAEFSGGQRQRIAIARALVLQPELVVCDEPTSALDLSVQAQILNLLLDLQARYKISYLFISHDIDVVRHVSHRVGVLHQGELVEHGPAPKVTSDPDHWYTQRLLKAAPVPDPRQQRQRRAERHQESTLERDETSPSSAPIGDKTGGPAGLNGSTSFLETEVISRAEGRGT